MVSSRFIDSLFVRCALYSRCAACSSYTAIQNEHQKSTKSTTSIYLYKIYISVYPHRVRIQTVNWRMISQHQQPTTHDFWFQNNLKPAVSGRVVRFPLFKTWNTIQPCLVFALPGQSNGEYSGSFYDLLSQAKAEAPAIAKPRPYILKSAIARNYFCVISTHHIIKRLFLLLTKQSKHLRAS